jgi:hypothetical protein
MVRSALLFLYPKGACPGRYLETPSPASLNEMDLDVEVFEGHGIAEISIEPVSILYEQDAA